MQSDANTQPCPTLPTQHFISLALLFLLPLHLLFLPLFPLVFLARFYLLQRFTMLTKPTKSLQVSSQDKDTFKHRARRRHGVKGEGRKQHVEAEQGRERDEGEEEE